MAEQKKGIIQQFREFALEGNVLEIAIAFILGLYFKQVVDALVNGVILNLIGAVFGEPSFDDLTFKVGDGIILYGTFITAIVTFLIVAGALFALVKAFEHAKEMQKRGDADGPPAIRDCPLCFSEISAKASRCPACTGEIQPLVA
jgi:large conductance mechanosensitive channel